MTSRPRCCASRPRSAVWRPMKLETFMPACPGRGGSRARRAAGAGELLARRAVARLLVGADEAGQVLEERKLLAHEGAVDDVLALDLAEQAAQLGGALDGEARPRRRVISEARPSSVTSCGLAAEDPGGADEQLGALGLQRAAALHLALDLGEAGEHGLDVLAARRGALAQDGVEQACARRRAARRGGRGRRCPSPAAGRRRGRREAHAPGSCGKTCCGEPDAAAGDDRVGQGAGEEVAVGRGRGAGGLALRLGASGRAAG